MNSHASHLRQPQMMSDTSASMPISTSRAQLNAGLYERAFYRRAYAFIAITTL